MSQTGKGSRPCTFFSTPRGCRNGDSCPFSHGAPITNPATASSSRSSGEGHARQRSGVCHFFVAHGRCKFGNQCQYRHDTSGGGSRSSAPQSSLAGTHAVVPQAAPFLQSTEISVIDTTNHDLFRSVAGTSLSFGQIKTQLWMYLRDDFRFAKTFNVYAFWLPLQSIHRSNSLLVS